jgi:hypothetical protein
MSETWETELIGSQIYGSGIFGTGYYGSVEWTDGTTPSATWSNLTDTASTWTDFYGIGDIGNAANTVVVGADVGVTSYSIQEWDVGHGTGGYHGNWLNNGNNAVADKINISSFDSNNGLRVSLVDHVTGYSNTPNNPGTYSTSNFLSDSNPSGGLPDNDKIIFWGDDLPSNLVAGTVYYVKQTSDDTKINLRTVSGGDAIAYVDSGSGTNYCSTTFFEATGGTGSGFIGTYDINPTNGYIYSVNIYDSGNYTVLPTSFAATCPSTRFHYQGYSGAPACRTATVIFSLGSLDLLFTDTDHTLVDGDEIRFITSGTLPGSITIDTNYYVNDATDTTFKVETVIGGGNVQYSSTVGSGVSYDKTTTTWSELATGSTTWTEA